jgi:hypothetical protein
MKKYNVLIATPFLSEKPIRGYETIALSILLDLTKAGHQVDLISFYSDGKRKFNANILGKHINKLLLINVSKFQRFFNLLKGFFIGESFQISFFKGGTSVESEIFKYVRSEEYDLMISITIRTSRFLIGHNFHAYKVIHLIDPHIINYSKSFEWENIFMKLIYFLDYSKLYKYENEVLKYFHLRTLISDEDINDLSLIYGLKFEKLTYGSSKQSGSNNFLNFDKRDKNRLVVTGNMAYKPNVVGVEWFCKSVFPLLLEHYPSLTLYVVGSNPSKRLLKLKNKNIIFTGYVKNLSQFLSTSFVSICPVKHRIGVQTKILEAFSEQLPVISTSNSNSGINAINYSEILIADNPEEFLLQYQYLLNQNNWETIARNSFNLYVNKFNLMLNVHHNNLMIFDRIKATKIC